MGRNYDAVGTFLTGKHAATTAVKQIGINVPCRRVLLVAEAGVTSPVVVPQGQPAAVGFPIPKVAADGSFHPLELWVNQLDIIFVSGSGGNILWFAECVE